ncbi:MAG: TIGR03643 family protein [SAR86 cluster bacterium]|uniref:TIGR03643 family protein n=1 Tax=SAR86 cluster bacterium TaxID=2030880 RepID=A0A520N595_9GAMM|nr:MAG: TIGR03643 family protein [SAR86 cluster bacterium]|tara:strand:- start:247 stop:498 length:252 start_codon:yes stop_codon:yes gene_type:complete
MNLSESDISRIIEMAWEDRTPFDAIEIQFNLSHDEVVNLMRKNLKKKSFNSWRERVRGRKTKHSELRNFKVGRHHSYDQNKLK